MAMRPTTGPRFVDWDANAKQLKYRVAEHLAQYIADYSSVLGDLKAHIDIKWEADPAHHATRLTAYVNNWCYQLMVDESMLDEMQHDTKYLEYIREQVTRGAQTGLGCQWLDNLFSAIEHQHDVGQVYRDKIAPHIRSLHFHQGKRTDHHHLRPMDLCSVVFEDNPIPLTDTIEIFQNDPKFIMAKMLMIVQ
jgi:hypothetical protein